MKSRAAVIGMGGWAKLLQGARQRSTGGGALEEKGRPIPTEARPARSAHVHRRVALVRLDDGARVLLHDRLHLGGRELRERALVVKQRDADLRVAEHGELCGAAHQLGLAARKLGLWCSVCLRGKGRQRGRQRQPSGAPTASAFGAQRSAGNARETLVAAQRSTLSRARLVLVLSSATAPLLLMRSPWTPSDPHPSLPSHCYA